MLTATVIGMAPEGAVAGDPHPATPLPTGLQAALATMGFGSLESLNAWAATAQPEERESVFNAIALILMASQEGG